jgi:hypothetical protein
MSQFDKYLDSLTDSLCEILRKRSTGEELTGKEIILSLIYQEEVLQLEQIIEEKMKNTKNVSRVTDKEE